MIIRTCILILFVAGSVFAEGAVGQERAQIDESGTKARIVQIQGIWKQVHVSYKHPTPTSNPGPKFVVINGQDCYTVFGVFGVLATYEKITIRSDAGAMDFVNPENNRTVRCLYRITPERLSICKNNRGKTLVRPQVFAFTDNGNVIQHFAKVPDSADRAVASTKAGAALSGIWMTLDFEKDGERLKPIPEIIFDCMRERRVFYFRDWICTMFEADGELKITQLSYEVRASDTKNEITLTGKGDTIPGIFEMKRDRMTLCWKRGGGSRPTEFSTQRGDGCGLMHLKRVGAVE